ncbi:MAG: thioesterase family protein [Candidatus Acidiferrales bacterium]
MKRPVPKKKRARAAKPSASPSKIPPAAAKHSGHTHESKLRPGLQASIERVVLHEWTIASLDSRLPAVLSTPHMIGLMEIAAAQAIMAELPPGAISVGTRIEVDHLKAVPAGATVRASAQLAQHDGRFLVFDVEARSGDHLIGRGRVFRAIVEPQKFHANATSRKS